MTPEHQRSMSDIVHSLIGQVACLVRSEGQLARAELSEKAQKLIAAIVLLLAGAVLILPAGVILLESAVAALIQAGLTPPFAALLVGAAVLIVAIVLLLTGVNRLKSMSLVPDKTLRQIQRNFAIVKDVHDEHDVQRAA